MEFKKISINKIEPSPYQPRTNIDKDYIQHLADSIESHGLINAITVKPIVDGKYQIITGEMRWRAHQLAKLETIDAIVKDVTKEEHQKESLIENIHRKDLSMEEKGRGVYAYFRIKGIKGTPKEIAKACYILFKEKEWDKKLKKSGKERQRKRKEKNINRTSLSVIKKSCDELSLEYQTVSEWLEFLSVPQDIRTMELSRPADEQQQSIIARLSAMSDDPDLQKLTYIKIRKDGMDTTSASKFITAIKKVAKEDPDLAKVYTSSDIKFDLTETPKGYTITIPQEELERIQMTALQVQNALDEIARKPITWERQFHTRNWSAHQGIIDLSDDLMCPFCGQSASEHLGWKCKPDKTIQDIFRQAEKNYEEAQEREEANLLFLKGMNKK